MQTIQLQVQDDYVEEFLNTLPKEKVKVVDQTFLEHQQRFQAELQKFKDEAGEFPPYHEEMKAIDAWLKERAEQ